MAADQLGPGSGSVGASTCVFAIHQYAACAWRLSGKLSFVQICLVLTNVLCMDELGRVPFHQTSGTSCSLQLVQVHSDSLSLSLSKNKFWDLSFLTETTSTERIYMTTFVVQSEQFHYSLQLSITRSCSALLLRVSTTASHFQVVRSTPQPPSWSYFI